MDRCDLSVCSGVDDLAGLSNLTLFAKEGLKYGVGGPNMRGGVLVENPKYLYKQRGYNILQMIASAMILSHDYPRVYV